MAAEVFEICDFTSASDWERFVTHLEEMVTQWTRQCPKRTRPLSSAQELGNGKWRKRTESLRFARTQFSLEFHALLGNDYDVTPDDSQSDVFSDMMAEEHDFPAKSHHLVRWFGLRHFLVLVATEESIATEDRTQLLLSSAAMALSGAKSHLPLFCQLGTDGQRRLYSGVALDENQRTLFQMIHLKTVPNQLRHLSALVALFRDKVYHLSSTSSSTSSCAPILVSIRCTYAINEWPTLEDRTDEEEEEEESGDLFWPQDSDPVRELQLAVTWPSLSEEVVLDSDVHSDLEPNNGENWSLRAIFKPITTERSLHQSLSQLSSRTLADERILAEMMDKPEVSLKEVFNPLLLPTYSSSSSFSSSQPWNRLQWVREQTIRHIFCAEDIQKEWTGEEDEEEQTLRRALKSAPKDSLSRRIATTLANAYFRFEDLADLALLWREVLSRLRHCWDSSSLLPFMSSGTPDLNTCLLHQKLQMFYCCCEAKRNRTMNVSIETTVDNNNSDDEMFFDCNEEEEETSSLKERKAGVGEGRLERLGNERLVAAEEEFIFVPKTQTVGPMTEDMVEEQMAVLSRLGHNKESQSIRARMQSAGLQSDMEAFKAANPRALFEDFVRWHSPRDWIQSDEENGGRNGALSPRFRANGNMWREVWDSAESVPADKQKRLFDETTEAEKILHFLSSVTSKQLLELIFPLLMHSSVERINRKCKQLKLKNSWDFIVEKRATHRDIDLNREHFLNELKAKETQIRRFESLSQKFLKSNQKSMDGSSVDEEVIRECIHQLIDGAEVQFSSFQPLAQLIRQMFAENQLFLYEKNTTVGERDYSSASLATFPDPMAKEFIIRSRTASSTAVLSSPQLLPQRMYCLLSSSEFRICGAFTEDLTYF